MVTVDSATAGLSLHRHRRLRQCNCNSRGEAAAPATTAHASRWSPWWLVLASGCFAGCDAGPHHGCSPGAEGPQWSIIDGAVVIPTGTTTIEDYAYDQCAGLVNISMPNTVTSIGRFAFQGCTSLVSVTIPETVTSVGFSAFAGCTSLVGVTIPEKITTIDIGDRALPSCCGYGLAVMMTPSYFI